MGTAHLWKYKQQIRTVKQKAIFVYLNGCRMQTAKSEISFYDLLGDIKHPFNKLEVDHVVGDLSKKEFAEAQLWLNIMDAITKIDDRLVYNCEKFINFIKETVYLESFDSQIKVKRLEDRMGFAYISSQYISHVKVIILNILHLYALNKIMDDPFEVNEDLAVNYAVNTLIKVDDIFADYLATFTGQMNESQNILSIKRIYVLNTEVLKQYALDMLKVLQIVLLQFNLRITNDQIKELVDYSDKKFYELIFT
ncbi:hypothetical protein B6D29_00010 [Microgenomates bacterium UTCPR1]|nr:MAG: hypothetical protein B6D29_00010 [Microgenomates bacterium UTCPR1]